MFPGIISSVLQHLGSVSEQKSLLVVLHHPTNFLLPTYRSCTAENDSVTNSWNHALWYYKSSVTEKWGTVFSHSHLMLAYKLTATDVQCTSQTLPGPISGNTVSSLRRFMEFFCVCFHLEALSDITLPISELGRSWQLESQRRKFFTSSGRLRICSAIWPLQNNMWKQHESVSVDVSTIFRRVYSSSHVLKKKKVEERDEKQKGCKNWKEYKSIWCWNLGESKM